MFLLLKIQLQIQSEPLLSMRHNQKYLKSLIAPQMNIESDSNIANILTGYASNFNSGTSGGWSSWGNNKEEQTIENGIGEDGTACMALKNKVMTIDLDVCRYRFQKSIDCCEF